jgi:hypothetical protein
MQEWVISNRWILIAPHFEELWFTRNHFGEVIWLAASIAVLEVMEKNLMQKCEKNRSIFHAIKVIPEIIKKRKRIDVRRRI